MESPRWRIEFLGGLRVIAPDGALVRFPTQKAAAVVAMLALRGGRQVLRSEIAEALWPGLSRRAQLANLRQTFLLLRQLGEDGPIAIGNDAAWLALDRVDLGPSPRHPSLLPEMAASWFDEYRGDEDIEATIAQQHAAGDGFLLVMDWMARCRPREGLEVVRLAPELAEMTSPTRLAPLIDSCLSAVGPGDSLYGWGMALRGLTVLMTGRMDRAIKHLIAAHEYSLVNEDPSLTIFSTFYLGNTLCCINRAEEGLKVTMAAAHIKAEGHQAVRLGHGRGVVLMHNGQFSRALHELHKARDSVSDGTAPYEHAYLLANTAWFESTVGDSEVAARLVEELDRMPGSESIRLRLTSMLTRAALYSRRGEDDKAAELLERIIQICSKYGMPGFEHYAWEIMALAAIRKGQRAEAASMWARAKKLRISVSSAITAWDRHRLKPLQKLAS